MDLSQLVVNWGSGTEAFPPVVKPKPPTHGSRGGASVQPFSALSGLFVVIVGRTMFILTPGERRNPFFY